MFTLHAIEESNPSPQEQQQAEAENKLFFLRFYFPSVVEEVLSIKSYIRRVFSLSTNFRVQVLCLKPRDTHMCISRQSVSGPVNHPFAHGTHIKP